MKKKLLTFAFLALTALTSVVGCGGGDEDDFEALLDEYYGSSDSGGSGDGDNFWSSDASDSAGNFDENGEGYVCVDGVCY